MCCEARSQAHLLSSIVLLAMSLAKLKRSACIVGNDIHVKKMFPSFLQGFSVSWRRGGYTRMDTEEFPPPPPEGNSNNFCFASNFYCNNAALFPNVFWRIVFLLFSPIWTWNFLLEILNCAPLKHDLPQSALFCSWILLAGAVTAWQEIAGGLIGLHSPYLQINIF